MPSAERQARLAENARQQAINEGVGQVNAIFGAGREQDFDDFLQALRERSSTDLTEQKRGLDLQTKFAAARRGVVGGSADIDAQRRNRRAFIQSLIGAENQAQGAVSRLRAQDENTRQGLLNMIFGRLDASTAAQRAGSSAQANLQGELSSFVPQALNQVAGAGVDTFITGSQADAFRRGSRSAREALFG